jgi:phosphomannomutase
MNLYLFDVDGVLCDTGCKIDPEFQSWFIDWSKDKQYALVTGGEYTSTVFQIGKEIVENAYMSFHCMGNHIFIKDREYKINQFDLSEYETQWLEAFINKSGFRIKTGNHIDIRTGSVNFSIAGRNATLEQKKQYLAWDSLTNERLNLIEEFEKKFPHYQAFIGGNASIDICLYGAHKGNCVSHFGMDKNFEVVFFGDKCFERGIDYPLHYNREHSHWIKNGYKDTLEVLKQI